MFLDNINGIGSMGVLGHMKLLSYTCKFYYLYRGTSELRTPRDHAEVSIIGRCISSSNVIVLITVILFLLGDPKEITLENRHQSSLCKVYGDKSDDTAFLSEHVIILYLLWHTCTYCVVNTWAYRNIECFVPWA